MRILLLAALLLPIAPLNAESYWQRFKNYLTYLWSKQATLPTAPTVSATAPATPSVPPTAKELLQRLKQAQKKPVITSSAITSYKGIMGEPHRTSTPVQTIIPSTATSQEKPIKINGPTVPEKPKTSEINLQPLIIQERIIDGHKIIQLKVAEQTANYCGYHALKNAIAIANALYFNNSHNLEMLQSDMDPQWLETIQKIRKSNDVEWLTQEEIYRLINTFAAHSPYPITVIEDINRLKIGEGIVDQTMRGLLEAQKHLEGQRHFPDKKYIQAFVVGTMNQETNRAGHWVTIVLWIHEGTIEFIIADSLHNRPFFERPTTLEFINLLTHMDFYALSIISSEEMQQYLSRLNAIYAILQKKEYALKESDRSIRKDLPIYLINVYDLPTLTIDAIEDFIKEAEKKLIFTSPAFAKIREFLSNLLNVLKNSHEHRFKSYQNTGENSPSIEQPLQIYDYQWGIINDLLQKLKSVS